MFTLKNDELEVTLLDPVADRERFHTRYCAGGYIFQITDARHGPLLTGPTYPESFNTFDGQGIPDAFNLGPLREPGSATTESLIIGIGVCDLKEDRVISFSKWDVELGDQTICMTTNQSYQGYSLELTRTVALHGRTIHSAVHLKNTSARAIPVCWFPHPFYPQPESDELCRFNVPVSFPENDGYELGGNGFIYRKNWPWAYAGPYQALDHNAQTNLVVLQRHPALGMVSAICSYVPALLPIWGNANTISWEPFFEKTAAAGQELNWWIDYIF